jgi:hypothetical protein
MRLLFEANHKEIFGMISTLNNNLLRYIRMAKEGKKVVVTSDDLLTGTGLEQFVHDKFCFIVDDSELKLRESVAERSD